MKRLAAFMTGTVLALTAVLCTATGTAAASAETNGPFARGTLSCSEFRIPALLTLQDGAVVASADMRWGHGADSPQNIDTGFARSIDGLGNWEHSIVNHFDDYADGADSTDSASFIDSALVQSQDGTLFLITEAYASGIGIRNTEQGNGCIEYQGETYIALAERDSEDYRYHIADFENGFAPVMDGDAATDYSVDTEYRLYQNGTLLTQPQRGTDGEPNGSTVAQSIFYKEAALHVFPTPFLWLRSSRDGGVTWSAPQVLNPAVGLDTDCFLGVCPGRGLAFDWNGGERLLFALYLSDAGKNEQALCIYSDDGGQTWQRGEAVQHAAMLKKTSESQPVLLPDGRLRLFSRNSSRYVACCDSTDGGQTWTKARPVEALRGRASCMISALTLPQPDGTTVVLCAMPGDSSARADGVLRAGTADEAGNITWNDELPVNDGFFAYSCMTALSDGSIALLYEDEASHFAYCRMTVDGEGKLAAADGNTVTVQKKNSLRDTLTRAWDQVLLFFERLSA